MKQLVFSPESLGAAIKRARNLKGLNQTKAGEPFKIEQTTFSSIENGASGTRLETLFRVLAALNLEMIIQSQKVDDEVREAEW